MFKKLLLGIIGILILHQVAFGANEWRKGTGENVILGSEDAADIDTISYNNIVDPLDRVLADYRRGTELVYASASTLTVNLGEVVCSNTAGNIRKFRRNTSAITTSWSVAANGLDAGTEAAATTYYVYAIGDADATTFTVVISTNSTTPGGTSHDYYKRLGSFYNDASSNITQVADDVYSKVAYTKGQGSFYKIDSGTGTTSGLGGSISFDFTYATAPVVITYFITATGSDSDWVVPVNITTTGATINSRTGVGTRSFSWISVGQVLAQ